MISLSDDEQDREWRMGERWNDAGDEPSANNNAIVVQPSSSLVKRVRHASSVFFALSFLGIELANLGCLPAQSPAEKRLGPSAVSDPSEGNKQKERKARKAGRETRRTRGC